MRELSEEEKILNLYIRNEMGWVGIFENLSSEMRMTIAGSFRFQVYLLRVHWRRFKAEILVSTRRVLEHLRYK